MLALVIAMLTATTGPRPTVYQVRVDVIRGLDTMITTFRMEGGVVGEASFSEAKWVTRVRATVRQATSAGCLSVAVGSVTAPDVASVNTLAIEWAPVIHLCGASTGRVQIEGGPSYRVTVRELAVPD